MSNYLKIDDNPHNPCLRFLSYTLVPYEHLHFDAAHCSHLNAALCSHLVFDAAQCSHLSFYAVQCSHLSFDAAQCGYTHSSLRSSTEYKKYLAHSGYKMKKSQLQRCLSYIKPKYWLLERIQRTSFEKNIQPQTINNKFSYLIFLSDNMALYFIDDNLVKKILHIAFILRRGFYYRHDFVALLNKIHKRLKIFNFSIIFIFCLQLYTNFFSKYYAHRAFLTCQNLLFKNINQYYKSKIEHNRKCFIGGGAHDSNFISSELFPYNGELSNMIGIFKFHLYVADSMKLAILNNNSNLYECNMPLNILICRLKSSELKLIASAHQIKYGSKVKINELRTLILEHKCQSCVFYTSIFEFRNQIQNKKLGDLKASKKYQNKLAEAYKIGNLKSVKKYQNIHAEEYKLSHLNSVKKHQQEHAEEYKLNNLNSVKQYQQEHAEEYKLNNLNSVKQYQQEHAEEYKLNNLNSVKQYQQEHAEEYKLNNLNSVKQYQQKNTEHYKKKNLESVKKYQNKVQFPPEVLSKNLQHKIITDFVSDASPDEFEESGCAICGN